MRRDGRALRKIGLLALLACAAPLAVSAQTAGGACTAGELSGPDADGHNLICSGSVWTKVGTGTVDGSGSAGHIPYWSDTDTLTYDNGRFYWDAANDRLGIGTSTPSSILHLASTTLANAMISIGNTGGRGMVLTGGVTSDGAYNNIARIADAGIFFGTATQNTGTFALAPGASGGSPLGLRMLTSANVGLNVITPTATLQVSGSLIVSTSAQTTDPSLFVGTDGFVGLGTSSPKSRLQLGSSLGFTGGTNTLINFNNYWDTTDSRYETLTSGYSSMIWYGTDTGKLSFGMSSSSAGSANASSNINTWRMVLDPNGQLALGHDSPSTTLHVYGNTPRARLQDTTAGDTDITQTMTGLELVANAFSTSAKYTPALKFGSTDPDFSTQNPKFLAGIVGVATEAYNSDSRSGMALAFLTTPDNGGATVTPTEVMRVTQQGRLGIATNAPGSALHVVGEIRNDNNPARLPWNNYLTTGATVMVGDGQYGLSSGGSGLYLWAQASGGFISFRPGATEALRVTAPLNIGIGTSSPAARLDVVSSTTGAAVARFQNADGACTFTPASSGAGTWSCSSDAQLKTDITDAAPVLNWFDTFRIRDYTMKAGGSRQTGVIAQEVQTLHPTMVHADVSGTLMVDAPGVWQMVKAIQELKAANNNLTDANARLEERVRALEAR